MSDVRMGGLLEEHPLLVLPSFAAEVGLNEAIFVQQLHYWSDRVEPDENGDRWVYNTHEQWREQFPFWSTDTIKRLVLKLEKDGLLKSRQPEGTNRRKHYALNRNHPLLRRGQDALFHEGNLPSSNGARRSVLRHTETKTETTHTKRAVPRVGGKPVKAQSWQLTEDILASFNEQAGTKLRLLTSAGQPSEAAKRIYGRVRDYPDLSLDRHRDIIERTLASRWWGDGPPSIGVVYGPKVFEDNITRKPVPTGKGRRGANLDELRAFGRKWDEEEAARAAAVDGTAVEL